MKGTRRRGISKPRRKLPTLTGLKAGLQAGAATALRKAEANAVKLIGRPRI